MQSDWQIRQDSNGQTYYYNTKTQQSSLTINEQQISHPAGPMDSMNPSLITNRENIGLPHGWEKAVDDQGRTYYVDHINKTTSWDDPRKKLLRSGLQTNNTQNPNTLRPVGTFQTISKPITIQSNFQPTTSGLISNQGFSPVALGQSGLSPGLISNQGFSPVALGQSGLSPSGMPSNFGFSPTPHSGLKTFGNSGFGQTTGLNQPQLYQPVGISTSQIVPSTNITSTQQTIQKVLCISKANHNAVKESTCATCETSFSLFSRGNTCGCCSRIFCDKCTSYTEINIKTLNVSNTITCKICADHLVKGTEECISRLVPYVSLTDNDTLLIQALSEIASLLSVQFNVEISVKIKLVQALWKLISDSHFLNVECKTKALGILSMVASRDISLSLNNERAGLLFKYMTNNQPEALVIESLKCVAFLSMQAQNKQIFLEVNVLLALLPILNTSPKDNILQWASMALYYLATSSLEGPGVNIPPGFAFEGNNEIFSSLLGLLKLLSNKNEKIIQFITGSFEILVEKSTFRSKVYEVGGVDLFIQLLAWSDSSIIINVFRVLLLLCQHEGSVKTMIQRHATMQVVSIIESSTDLTLQELGLSLLTKLSQNQNFTIVAEEMQNLLPFISNQLSSSNHKIQSNVMELTLFLSSIQINRAKFGTIGIIHSLSALLSSSFEKRNFNTILVILKTLTHLSCDTESNIKIVIESGAFSTMVELLGSGEQQVVLESARSLSSIASNHSFAKYMTIELSGLLYAIAIDLLNNTNTEIQENILLLFSDLTNDPTFCQTMASSDDFENITKFLSNQQINLQKHAVHVIRKLSLSPSSRDILGTMPKLLGQLIYLLGSSNAEVREHACFAFLDCCSNPSGKDKLLEIPGAISTILRLASIPSPAVKLKSITIISNCVEDAKFRQTFRDGGALALLVDSLFDKDESIQEIAALSLSNLVTSEKDAESVYGMGGLLSLIHLLKSNNARVLLSVIQVISNLSHFDLCRKTLVESGVVNHLIVLIQNDVFNSAIPSLNALVILSSHSDFATAINSQTLQQLTGLLFSLSQEAQGLIVYILINICKLQGSYWSEIQAIIGVKGLSLFIKSLNVEARQLAVRQIAEISVDSERTSEITESGVIKSLITVFSSNSDIGSSTQMEALLAIANISFDINVQKDLLDGNGFKLLVPYLTKNFGDTSLFSVARIFGNFVLLLQNDADFASAVKELIPLGIFTSLTNLFFEVTDAEVKYNIIICLPTFSSSSEELSSLVEKGIVLSIVQLLSNTTLEEHIRCACVLFLSQLIVLDNFRNEILKNKEIFSLLILSMKDVKSRYSILEIFQKLSESDNSFLNEFQPTDFEIFFIALSEEISSTEAVRKVLTFEILCNIVKGSSQVRLMILSNQEIFSSLLSSLKEEPLVLKASSLLKSLLNSKECLQFEEKKMSTLTTLLDIFAGEDKGDGVILMDLLGIQSNISVKLQVESISILTCILSTLASLSVSGKIRSIIADRAEVQRHINNILLIYVNGKYNDDLTPYNTVLTECFKLIHNLYYSEKFKEYFESQAVGEKLFSLLQNQSLDQPLKLQILALIRNIVESVSTNKDAIVRFGIDNLIGLLSNQNDDTIIFHALDILKVLSFQEIFLEIIRNKLSQTLLLNLKSTRGEIIKNVASELSDSVGFGF